VAIEGGGKVGLAIFLFPVVDEEVMTIFANTLVDG
jgi:hypothetical protein